MMRLILFLCSLLPSIISFKILFKRLPSKGLKLYNTIERNPSSGAYDFNQWKKAFVSQPNEFNYTIKDIKGKLPKDLEGTLFRAMPALFERGDKRYGHYLDGDGYIIKVTISNGIVTFKSKFVKTEEYVKENNAQKVLFRSTFRTQRKENIIADTICINNAFDLKLKNGANTNVIFWADALLVLFEAGVPYKLDTFSLDTLKEDDLNLGNQLKSGMSVLVPILKQYFPGIHDEIFGSSMTAHPKIDPVNNRLIGWTWRAKVGNSPLETNPQLEIHEWDSLMKKELPSTTHDLMSTTVAPHDFSISENYYVFIENRVKGNTIPYILGKKCPAECVDIIPTENMILNLVKRPKISKLDQSAIAGQFLTIPLTPGFTIHSVCAWEEYPSRLTLITTAWDTQTVSSGKVKGGLLGAWQGVAPNFDDIPVTLLYRTLVDISTGQLLSHAPVEGMEKIIVEHPHVNPNYESQKARYLWMSIGSLEGISSPPLGYLKLDLETGDSQKWFAPLHNYCEELVIVPKSKVNDDDLLSEDDVYLIATIFNANINKSKIAIFDGKDMCEPLCELPLDHQLPHSLHGCFTKSIIE